MPGTPSGQKAWQQLQTFGWHKESVEHKSQEFSKVREYPVEVFYRKNRKTIELSMDQSGREVRKEDRLLDLTAKEFDLLLFFMENPGKVFTKKQIYRADWNDEYAYDDNNIMVHIRRLRKKIEDSPENPKYILTVWGVGYKFGGETE